MDASLYDGNNNPTKDLPWSIAQRYLGNTPGKMAVYSSLDFTQWLIFKYIIPGEAKQSQ